MKHIGYVNVIRVSNIVICWLRWSYLMMTLIIIMMIKIMIMMMAIIKIIIMMMMIIVDMIMHIKYGWVVSPN